MNSTSTTSFKRRVSFNKQVEAVHIKHHRDYSKNEIESSWYSQEEFEAIKAEANHTLECYNGPQHRNVSDESSVQSLEETSNFCMRGLEHRTDSGMTIRYHLRRAAWNAVLDEQDVQYDLGTPNNCDMLREVYSMYSLAALRIAQQRGWNDAIQAGYAMDAQSPVAVITKTCGKASCLPATCMEQTPAQKNSIVSQAA